MLTGYMKIDDIPGESLRADHEEEIDVHDISWNISQRAAAQIGSGRSQSRAEVSSVNVEKFYDASSPYLALACMQGKSFPEVTISVRKDSGDAHLDYLIITMERVVISSYDIVTSPSEEQLIEEHVGLTCESIKIKYTIQADDHSAGDEHEIEYDIAAGA